MRRAWLLIVITAFFLTALPATGAYAAGQMKIGYFDITRVITKSEAGKAKEKELTNELESVKKEVKKYEDMFTKKRSEFDSKSLLWGEKVRREKLKELALMERQLQERRRAAEIRLRQVQRRLMDPLLRDVKSVLERVGKRGGYSIIFERGQAGIFYAPGAYDLTDRVIKEFNVMYEKKSKERKKR